MEIIFIATLMETALVAILLASFFIIRYFLSRNKNAEQLRRGKQNGSKIEKAVVLSVEHLPVINNNPKTKILVKVMPQNGRNFVIELNEKLSFTEMSGLHTGGVISVQYDGINTKSVSLLKTNPS